MKSEKSLAIMLIRYCGCIFRGKLHTGWAGQKWQLAKWLAIGWAGQKWTSVRLWGFRIPLTSVLGQKWRRGFVRGLVGVTGKLAMQEEGLDRCNIEYYLQNGVRRVRSTSLGELKSISISNTNLGELKSSSSSETFSAARRLVLDSVLGRFVLVLLVLVLILLSLAGSATPRLPLSGGRQFTRFPRP